METDPKIWIGALRRSHEELVALVDSLEGDGLLNPVCSPASDTKGVRR
jgi:hypothetical protein